jgi:hypothetical protein
MSGQLNGLVIDSTTSAPIQNALVYLFDTTTIMLTTDASGAFSVPSLGAGIYSLSVCSKGYESIHNLSVQIYENKVVDFTVYLMPVLSTFNNNLYGWNQNTNSWQQLYTNEYGSISASNPFEMGTILGNYYIINTGLQSVAANEFFALQLTNPLGSSKIVSLNRANMSGPMSGNIEFIRNGAFPDDGTALVPMNANFSSANKSLLTSKYVSQSTDPVIGGVNLISSIVTYPILDTNFDGRIILNPGNTLAIRFSNVSSSSVSLVMNISYIEREQ